MAGLQITGTVPEVRALYAALGAYADALPADVLPLAEIPQSC